MHALDHRPLGWAALICATTLACTPAIKVGDLDTDGSTSEATMTDGATVATATVTDTESGSGTDTTGPVTLDVAGPGADPTEIRKMDILLVVDNSSTMGPKQARMVDAVSQFTAVLDSPGIAVDWRLGITTTDNGNPWCQGTGPEAGALVASSCRSRLPDFIFQGPTEIDVTAEACTDICALEDLSLQPTAIPEDPDPKVRPWISGSCDANLDPDTLQDTLACAIPQGNNGCGFEQPLESMRKAIVRAQTPNEASYGFLRADAHLVVIFLTDEADCSTNNEYDSIFLPDGNRAFWDVDWAAPTSALCWRAGVECSGDPAALSCQSASYDVFGMLTTDPDMAVMRPVSRYQEILDEVQAGKVPGAGVYVVGALGLPLGGGAPVYVDVSDTDPQQMTDFGIGPGCTTMDERAVPPVRMLELQAGYPPPSGGNSSICDTSYSDTIEAVTSIVGAGIIPSDQVCP
jgi:hypothetical protein